MTLILIQVERIFLFKLVNSEKWESSVEAVRYMSGLWIVKQCRWFLKLKRPKRDSENLKITVSGGIKNFKVCSFRMLNLIMLSDGEGKTATFSYHFMSIRIS